MSAQDFIVSECRWSEWVMMVNWSTESPAGRASCSCAWLWSETVCDKSAACGETLRWSKAVVEQRATTRMAAKVVMMSGGGGDGSAGVPMDLCGLRLPLASRASARHSPLTSSALSFHSSHRLSYLIVSLRYGSAIYSVPTPPSSVCTNAAATATRLPWRDLGRPPMASASSPESP